MTEGGNAPAAGGPSLVGVMPEVVKGLKDRPALLFGIGAGIVLVVVLGLTTNLWLVLVVAAVLVLSLGAWLVTEARRQTAEADIRNVATATRAKVKDSDVGVVAADAGSVSNTTDVSGAEISGSNVGVVGARRRRRRGKRA